MEKIPTPKDKNLEEKEKMSEEEMFRQDALDKASQRLAEALAQKEDAEDMAEAVAFHYYIVKNLCNRLTKKLFEIDYAKEEVEQVVNELMEIPERDAVSILLLSDRQMDIFFTQKKNEGNTVQSILDAFMEAGADKPTIGFHATPKQIMPATKIRNGRETEEWIVDGSEKDHRDNDLPMAYYSYDYTHLYRQNKSDYLYIVQSLPSHRGDPSNNWGRAPSLQIISEMKQENIKEYIEKMKSAARFEDTSDSKNKAA
ncbi:MAG: hypothetical protein WD335_00165 [Candidatus Paceibacterota bacterium]